MTFKMTAPCHFGLEKTLAFEVKRAGGTDVLASDGRVSFTGDERVLIRANISCSVAERIGIVLAEFPAGDFDALFDGVKSAPIEQYIGRNDRFPVTKGHSIGSKLTSIPAIQRTIKKALVTRMSEKYKTATFPETGALYSIRFLLMKDKMTLILDSSGEGLHKRGYRAMANLAPIKETLAAGIIDLARVRPTDLIIDPFCGSGTILIEAAMKAIKMPPCINRSFAAEEWSFIPQKLWCEERDALRSGIIKDSPFIAYGYDIDSAAINLTRDNAWKAGVDKNIVAERRAIKDFVRPEKECKIICNPPYGERMLEQEEADKVCGEMGKALFPLSGNKLYCISGNERFEELIGEKASKNRKLYNGMLLCRLYSYE